MNKQNFTTFYIVRHGETDWNAQKLIQGHSDTFLNKKGELQAKDLAKKLRNIKFDLIFSSDLLRAHRTAEIIALERKLEVQVTNLLRERFFGDFQGKPSKELSTYYQKLLKLNDKDRLSNKPARNAESDKEMISRIITFFRETVILYPGKTILIGTHGGVIRILLVHLGVYTYKFIDQHRVRNTGYIKLVTDGVDFFVEEINGIEPYQQIVKEI